MKYTTPAALDDPRTALAPARGRLSEIPTVSLSAPNQRLLDQQSDAMLGSRAWRNRKRVEAHGLLALAQIAPRIVVRHLDLRTELLAMVELRDTPVPCLAPGASDIHIERAALLAFLYPEELIAKPVAGTRSVRILEPRGVFHSNVLYGERTPPLCLGATIPRCLPLREMVIASYAALTLQSISLDELDPAGVLNAQAVAFFQANPDRIPLTADPFLGCGQRAADRETGGGRP